MNKISDVIDNYIETDESCALQIDGNWGVGKTYFIKKIYIPELKEKNCIYFSVYGFDNLNTLRQELFKKIILNVKLSLNTNITNKISVVTSNIKKMSKLTNIKFIKTFNLVSDIVMQAMEAQITSEKSSEKIIIFLDDLERLSENIKVEDLLGLISTELLEKLEAKVIILSNSLEIKNSEEYKKIKEKIIARTVLFENDLENIETNILKVSKNSFIKDNSSWIIKILENLKEGDCKQIINLRTLFSVISSFKFIESKLNDDINHLDSNELKLKIKKSIFLNIFVITNEYKLGNIDQTNLNSIDILLNTRYFRILTNTEDNLVVKEIVKKYHNKLNEFDDNIFYSSDINSYILFGNMNDTGYVKLWKNKFFSKFNKLNNFRRLSDEDLAEVQESIFEDIQNNMFNFTDLLKVYEQLYQFEKINLLFLDENYSIIIEKKLIQLYLSDNESEEVTMPFFTKNLKTDKKELFQKFDNQKKELDKNKIKDIIKSVFAQNNEVFAKIRQMDSTTLNIVFKVMLDIKTIDEYILITNSKADLLQEFIEYILDYEMGSLNKDKTFSNDLDLFIKEIKSKVKEINVGKIDKFKINELLESLEKLSKKVSINNNKK